MSNWDDEAGYDLTDPKHPTNAGAARGLSAGVRLTADERARLKQMVSDRARERAASGYLDCDPESLSRRALEAEGEGYDEIAAALRAFRDDVVNVLLGEGWTLDRIESATADWVKMERRG